MSIQTALTKLQRECHEASYKAGWWHHADTGLPYIPGDDQIGPRARPWEEIDPQTRNMIEHYWPILIACKIALIHSEVSEAMEAHRKGLMDDKLPHLLGMETEVSDAMIRQFDLMGAMEHAAQLGIVKMSTHLMDVGSAFVQKMKFNETRPDHKISVRMAKGGKAY